MFRKNVDVVFGGKCKFLFRQNFKVFREDITMSFVSHIWVFGGWQEKLSNENTRMAYDILDFRERFKKYVRQHVAKKEDSIFRTYFGIEEQKSQ